MEAHWRMNTLHRELDQVSSRFQMCSRTKDLCRGKTERQVSYFLLKCKTQTQ